MCPMVTGRESNATGDTHMIMAPFDDMDHRGLWLRDVESNLRRKSDDSQVNMRLLIPWEFVLAVGLVDESVKIPPGFQGTILTP
jgi:hypothetical protein